MESRYGALGLRQEYTYDEVMRAISEQPLKLEHPKRVGLRTYEDIFFQNLINDQAAYAGDTGKAGFSHDQPRQPPPRPDVFFDSRSDGGDGGGGGGGGRGDDDPYDGYPWGDALNDDDGQGPNHPFGRRPVRLPIQSGQLLPDFVGQPLQLPDPPNPQQNIIQEEGLQPPQGSPGYFGQVGQAAVSGMREGSINRVSEMGALAGGMAADYAANVARNRLGALGGAIRDGALDYRNFYFRELPEMVRGAFSRGPPPPPDFGQAIAAEAQGAEGLGMMGMAEAGGMAAGAMEGAELGVFGGPLGMMAGAALGGVAAETASFAFRNREAPQQQSTFLDARSLNNQNQSVRPLQPRLHRQYDETASGSGDAPGFRVPEVYRMNSREPSAEIMRPTAAPTPRTRERSAQSVIDELSVPMPRGERVRLQRNKAPPSQAIEGEPNPSMLEDRAPKESYIMQATAAPTAAAEPPRRNKRAGGYSGSPYAFPMSGAPRLPAPPRQRSREPPAPKTAPRNRRNKGPPKKKDDDSSKR